jgi:hypothetical protein
MTEPRNTTRRSFLAATSLADLRKKLTGKLSEIAENDLKNK